MESLFIRKILNICESLLFGDTKITLPTFLKKCKKQNVKVIRNIAEKIVAFLQSLPRNLALFQALEPTFEYILQDQLNLLEEEQEQILKVEKLEFKNHIMEYEILAALYIMEYYEYMFTESFINIIERKKKKIKNKKKFFSLKNYLARNWLEYGDKKNLTYYLEIKSYRYYETIEEYVYFDRLHISSSKTYDTFLDLALHLLSFSNEIVKIYNLEIDYE